MPPSVDVLISNINEGTGLHSNGLKQAQSSDVAQTEAPEQSYTAILHRTPFRPPTAISAQGIYITLANGTRLIDAVGGAAVTSIGHGNKRVIEAIKNQLEKMEYIYNVQLSNEPAEALAKMLVDSGNGVFELCGFVSGGSEAMEAAIKLARQYFYETGHSERKNFIARKLSYHGNTIATLGLGHHLARRVPYQSIIDNEPFHHVSPAYAKRYQHQNETEEQYVARLAKELDDKFQELGPNTVIAFVAETVVGATTGVVPPPKGYFKAMKDVCDRYGALLILDEVMSGMGRMGTLHAWEQYGEGAVPDIQAIAKGLGGGYASIGAVLMNKKVADGVRDGSGFWQHGHTYQAMPTACAASLEVQKIIVEDNLMANCRKMGDYLSSELRSKLVNSDSIAAPYIFDIRGAGAFWGIEFDIPLEKDFGQNPRLEKRFGFMLQAKTMEKGLVAIAMDGGIDGARGSHAMLAPPYNVTKEEVDEIVRLFVESVEELVKEVLV